MNTTPELYSFAFAAEHELFSGEMGKNIFQFRIELMFADFLRNNRNELFTVCDCTTDEEEQVVSILAGTGKSLVPEFISHKGDFNTLINFLAPLGNSADAYLRSKVRILEILFSLLERGKMLFLNTEQGMEYARIRISKQPIDISFSTRNGEAYNLSIAVEGWLLKKLQNLLYKPDPALVHNEVITAIHSILPQKKMMQKRTHVVLKENYVQIEIFGHHCALITDFSGGHNANEKLVLSGRYIDTALQMLALFAAAGTLFRLAENQ